MVQFIPARNTWSDIGERFAGGATEGYMNRADENALRKAVTDLGENASPRDILNAITNTKTHSKESKQNVLKNWMGVAEFEHTQQKYKDDQEIAKAKAEIDKAREIRENNRLTETQRHNNAVETTANTRNTFTSNQLAETKRHNQAMESTANSRDSDAVKKKAELAEIKKKEDQTKKVEEKAKVNSIVDKLALPDEQKTALREASLDTVEDLLKHQVKESIKPKKPTKAQQIIEESNAKQYIEDVKTLPEFYDTKKNSEYVSQLYDSMGATAPIKGILGVGKSKELETISFALLQPFIKLFNPAGVLAQKKLELMKDMYHIKASDFPWQVQGKLAAIERYNNQAIDRTKKRIDLYEKYDGAIPRGVMDEYYRENDTLLDSMINANVMKEEIKNIPLDPAEYETAVGPDGTRYVSDGTRWVAE